MDFNALPRRDLQALCKRNAIRANMSNAAMADALRSLQSVEGIDEIRKAAPPGMSSVKSAAEDVAVKELRHGCPHPRGCRSQATTRKATSHKMEEAALAPDCPQRSQEDTAARDGPSPVDAEAVSTGKRRTRRSRRSKPNKVSDQKEEAAATAQMEPIEPILFEKNLTVGEEKHNGPQLPRNNHGRITRSRDAARRMEAVVLAPGTLEGTQETVASEAAVSMEVEEESRGKRTRRSRRSKVKVSLDKKEEEEAATDRMESIVILEKSSDDPKVEAAMAEEITKPLEGGMHYQSPSTYSGKRRTRRSRRPKVKMALAKKEEVAVAARSELIADSSDGVIGSVVLSDKTCNDCKEKVLGATNFQEGIVEELEPGSDVQKSPSSAITTASPIRCILSTTESRGPVIEMAQDASMRGDGSFAESPVDPDTQDREDGFSLTGETVDQSNLLVNTLDRFVQPMYKFAVKEEKKHGECWWMLM